MGLRSKLATLWWFLVQPELYPQLIYLFYQRLFPHAKESTRSEATEWCKQSSVSSIQAIKHFTGREYVKSLQEIFPGFFNDARKMIQKLPVTMGGEADLELLYYLAEHWNAKTVVETGVAYGWSSAVLLLSLHNREDGMLYSTDMPYAKMSNEDFVGCLVPEILKARWKLIRLPDRQAFRKIEKQISAIDLCHYDSDKSYRGRMWAYAWLWSRLRTGGLFVSDDVNDNLAFRDFAEKVNEPPVIVYYEPEDKYVGLLIKSH
jgi:predicted O-methyltransferase YrrM